MLGMSALVSARDEIADRPALLLTGAKVLDPAGERWIQRVDVLIVGQRIEKIAPAGSISAGGEADRTGKPGAAGKAKIAGDSSPTQQTALLRGTSRIDLTGFYIIPGLIDLHSHLLLHPYNEASWDDQVLKESLELRTIRAVTAARATVAAGFTTLRDLGTEGAGFADVALRDAIAQGLIPGPRVFASTRAIVATGCYGPSGFDPRWDVPKGAQEATGVEGVRKAVREQIAAGADWVKFYADYRRVSGDPATATFSQDELNALVDEARSAGRPVAAHAATNEGIRRAVMAGVATIEHGYAASDEVLALMRERGVALCPTLAASEAMARYAGWKPGLPEPPRIRESKEMFARALKAKVTIACGSDVGVFPHGDNARELELMVAYGMTPAEALRAATSTAAKVLGKPNDLGRITVGALADMIATSVDPLRDVMALRRPALVIADGRVVVDLRAAGALHED